jgi:hypothetical protein
MLDGLKKASIRHDKSFLAREDGLQMKKQAFRAAFTNHTE